MFIRLSGFVHDSVGTSDDDYCEDDVVYELSSNLMP